MTLRVHDNSIAGGADYNFTGRRLHAHTGTDVETGLHYVDGRETIDAVEIERLVGPARVLLKTCNSAGAIREVEKRESWVGLGVAAAELLAESGPAWSASTLATTCSPACR